MIPTVSVIIPFFQKQEGLLRKAVDSVLSQEGQNNYHLSILIIDDESPVCAKAEIADLPEQQRAKITILKQPNMGPAAARNYGLNSVSDNTDFIAFQDSDDQWIPDHLSNALQALEAGFDFYFSDFYHPDQDISAFNRAKRIDPHVHPTICRSEHLHHYTDNMFNQVIFGNIIGTPTVVYRFQSQPMLRFREEFVNCGEDYLFWLDFVHNGAKIAFSSRCECICGTGVNIYAGSGWGTEEALNCIYYEIKYRKSIGKIFPLTTDQKRTISNKLKRLRFTFAREIIHRLRHKKHISQALALKHFRLDPLSFLLFPWFTARILASK